MLQKLSKLTNTSVINPTKSIVFIFWNIFLSSHDENNGSRYTYIASMYDNVLPCADIKPQLFIYNGRDLVLIIFSSLIMEIQTTSRCNV